MIRLMTSRNCRKAIPTKRSCLFRSKIRELLIENMPDHWKPYFQFAFCSGLRQGEQCGLKIDDIDWEKQIIHVRRAITKDEEGKKMEGPTKNML